MQRILILGCAGAGKTTLARTLGSICGLAVIHLDREYWRPGWIEPEQSDWAEAVAAILRRPTWIMDGSYLGTLPARLAMADAVIYLDLSRWRCLSRVILRTLLKFGRRRGDDISPGCPERFDWKFLAYVWRYQRQHRPRVLAALNGFDGILLMPATPSEVRAIADQISSTSVD